MLTKVCTKCDTSKEFSEFYNDFRMKDGKRNECGECSRKVQFKYYNDNKDKFARYAKKAYTKRDSYAVYLYHIWRKYGLTRERYESLVAEQKNLCKVCSRLPGGKRPLVVDHCHATGKVRGLLCYGCNRSLHVLDTPILLEAALRYIKQAL